MESLSFLVSPVKEYVTPAAILVSLSDMDTANVAIAAMNTNPEQIRCTIAFYKQTEYLVGRPHS